MPSAARLSRRAFLLGSAAGVAARPARAESPSVKIGILHPVTGPLAEPGQACRLAAQIAADEINAAGGVAGHSLEIVELDDEFSPEKAVRSYQQLAGTDGRHRHLLQSDVAVVVVHRNAHGLFGEFRVPSFEFRV